MKLMILALVAVLLGGCSIRVVKVERDEKIAQMALDNRNMAQAIQEGASPQVFGRQIEKNSITQMKLLNAVESHDGMD